MGFKNMEFEELSSLLKIVHKQLEKICDNEYTLRIENAELRKDVRTLENTLESVRRDLQRHKDYLNKIDPDGQKRLMSWIDPDPEDVQSD